MLDWWADEALELVAVDDWFDLGELQIELLYEVASFDDETNIFVSDDLLRGQTWDVDAWPVRADYLSKQMEFIVASVSFECTFLVFSDYFVDYIPPIEQGRAFQVELRVCSMCSELWYSEITHAFSEHLSKAYVLSTDVHHHL